MILTCPECATSYFVDETKFSADSRQVKCASCAHMWTAARSELAPDPVDGSVAVSARAADDGHADDDGVEVVSLAAPDLPRAFRAKAVEERKVRRAAATGVVWAGMAGVLAVIIALAAVFRIEMVNLWPKSAKAYAMAGLPVNSLGLVIEGVKVQPSLQEGHAALSISGVIRNVKDKTVAAPPLKITVLNKAGHSIGGRVAQPGDALVPPGETRHFALTILDPPATASDLEVAFAPEAARKGVRPARAVHHDIAPAPPALRAPEGPEPIEAKPLGAGDPGALAHHE